MTMDKITEIRELKNGLRVTVNEDHTLLLTRRDAKTFVFRERDAVGLAKLEHDLLLAQYPDALNRAVRLLAVRARSCAEVQKRLTDACYMESTVEMVLTKLQTNGLLDDEAFARQWVRDRAARQIGKARMLQELRQKGVDGAIAGQAIAAIEPEKMDAGAVKLARKLKNRYREADAATARRKTVQAMQRRGFSYGEARRALEQIWDETDE